MGKNPLWLIECEEEEEREWNRSSIDKGDITQMGRHLITLGGCLNLKIANGSSIFPNSSGFTCHIPQGKSAVDYLLLQPKTAHKIQNFAIGKKLPESPHNPLEISLVCTLTAQNSIQHQHPKGAMNMDYKKSDLYEKEVKKLMQETVWPTSCVEMDTALTDSLLKATHKIFSKGKGRSKGMPCNAWFDAECKKARLEWMEAHEAEKTAKEKTYKKITRAKKKAFLKAKQKEMFKKLRLYPKLFWNKLHKKEPIKDLDVPWEKLIEHIRSLYETRTQTATKWTATNHTLQDFFTLKEVSKGIQSLVNGKAADMQGMKAEMLKWGGDTLHKKIQEILNKAVVEGFPYTWQLNTLVPLFKSGDKEEAKNYRTIMISNLMAKLYGKILESRISSWAESSNIRAPSQAGFRPKHSTIDHLVTLKALMDGAKGKDKQIFCCFVDFKKAFDMVPRHKLWERIDQIGVPKELRAATARIYEKVIAELTHPLKEHVNASFISDIGVKQGCPLSPTLFGLFIDELEMWIREKGGGGVHIAGYVILLLLYADDVVLLAKNAAQLQRHLNALADFCTYTGMKVNIDKTKIMIWGKKDKSETITFEDTKLEVVKTYKYLGLDFEDNYKWNTCVEKRILGGLKALYSLQNKCRKANIWNWSMRKFLFRTLVQPVILYGCQVWGTSLSQDMWKKIEKIQKRFLGEELGAKVQTPYPMLLAETGMIPLEGEALCLLISYLVNLDKMDSQRIPVKVKEGTQDKGWFWEAHNWLNKWNISSQELPKKKGAIREFVQEKMMGVIWKDCQGKMEYYKKEINPMLIYSEQKYLKEDISTHKRHTICRYRVSSHELEIERGRWADIPRQERLCRICSSGRTEDEHHFIWQCQSLSEIRSLYDMQGIVPQDLYTFFSLPTRTLGSILIHMTSHRKTLLKDEQ